MSWRQKLAKTGPRWSGSTPCTIDIYKAISARQFTRMEDRIAKRMSVYFRESVSRVARGASKMDLDTTDPSMAITNANLVLLETFDSTHEYDQLIDHASRALLQAFIAGARSEEVLLGLTKQTSAEEIAQRLEYDVPDGIALGPYPQWMIDAAAAVMSETLDMPYWAKIPATTRGDIFGTLVNSFKDGRSINWVAREIMRKHGSSYSNARARNVARTELGHMANAGHHAGMRQLEEEGIPVQKVWLSVKGNTTRRTHSAASGQKRGLNEKFIVGGYEARWPSDASLPAKERCNCMCTILSDITEETFLANEEALFEEQEGDVRVQIDLPILFDVPIQEVLPEPEKDDTENGIPHIDQLKPTQIRLGGSTGAKVYEDEDGNKYVVKYGSSPEHVTEEFIAEELYRQMGVAVPPSRLIIENNMPVKISKFIEDARPLGSLSGIEKQEAIKKVQKHFGADAFLANWDAAGMGLDNIMVDPKGNVWRIDTGGALRFRAQGGPKGSLFSDEVTELWTLRNEAMNRDAHEVFGGMTFSKVRTSYRSVLSKSKNIQAKIDELDSLDIPGAGDLRAKLAARLESLKEIERQASDLIKDKYRPDYADTFLKHSTQIKAQGIADRFPESLTPQDPNSSKRTLLFDENNKLFDELRGSNSRTNDLRDYFRKNDLKYAVVMEYAEAQAGSSWSSQAVMAKFHNVMSRKVSPNDYFWQSAARKMMLKKKIGPYDRLPIEKITFGKIEAGLERALKNRDKWSGGVEYDATVDEFREALTAQHAFTYNLLTKTKMPNSDMRKRVLSLVRTESGDVMSLNKLHEDGDYGVMKRGAGESFSLVQTVTVGGNVLTYQEVPFHRVIGTYFQARYAGGDSGMFLGDSENEFVVQPHGLEVLRAERTGSGRGVLSRKEWEKRKKRKID